MLHFTPIVDPDPALLRLEQRVVAAALREPETLQQLAHGFCPCLFTDPRNAFLVGRVLRAQRRGRRLGYRQLAQLLWRGGPITLHAAEAYLGELALCDDGIGLESALLLLRRVRAAADPEAN